MTDTPDRPDPDELLRRVHAEDARAHRGRLKIFFGFAPGVGKTYRMLQVARDLICDQHLDVVVGLVETHRRTDTSAMLLGLELLPRKAVAYRGQTLEEFDLDLALARRPKVLLLDELAHTNAPGSRHAKRWQDVEELIEAGIDVYTTLNVQHVESLNDVVAQLTHVQVRETVPDAVLDAADDIELVDIAPDELLQRLEEGKVYLPDAAMRAAEHFFRRGNLLALRELALRRTAQHVDDDVQAYREAHGVHDVWPAGERILVCVGPAPSSSRLIRTAARMAAGLRCPWTAACVEDATLAPVGAADRARLDEHLRLAESLGGDIARLSGGHVATVLLGWARRQNVTRILIGKPTHSRLRDRLRGSLLDEIVRGSGDIDVHVISGAAGDSRPPVAAPPRARGGEPLDTRSYAASAGLVAATTLVALAIRAAVPIPDAEVLFLLAVMIAAVRLGRGPAILAAALGVAAYDFFFVPPYFTFAVADGRYILTFGMMFGIGLVVSELAARIRRQEQAAVAREERTAALYGLSREVGGAPAAEAFDAVARHAATCFDAQAFLLRPAPDGPLALAAARPEGASLGPHDLSVCRWAFVHGRPAGLGTDTLPGAAAHCAPLRVGETTLGVLALVRRERTPLTGEQDAFLEAFCRQAALALERIRLAEGAAAAALRARSEEMRSALLSAVSHDLRTPLATITGATSTLRDAGGAALTPGEREGLLESIADEAERLERLLTNLLDMTRLANGAVALKRTWVPLEEMVGSALDRLESRLGGRELRFDLAPKLPLLEVDPVVFEQVFVNLLENAAKYTPAGSPIEIGGLLEGPRVVVEIRDRGPGLPEGDEERVFDKFHRGPNPGVPGVGLGLSICRAIVEAHGGTVTGRSRPGGGAIIRIELPAAVAPSMLPAEPQPSSQHDPEVVE